MDIKELTKKIKHLEIFTNKNVNEVFAGNYKSSFKGQGLEVSDLRKYEEGDDVRHIDWTVSARQGTLYVKKYQETREMTTMVMVDLSSSMNFTSVGKTKKEAVVEFVAAILFSSLKNGDKFGAILFTEYIDLYIPPKKGKVHLLRILREIIAEFKENKYKKGDLNKALKYLNRNLKRNSICFLITDGDVSKSSSLLRIANKKHDFVFINVYDKFERGITCDGIMEIEDPETGEKAVIDFSNKELKERFLQIREEKNKISQTILKKNKIDCLNISTESNIYKELLIFFKKRQLRY